MLDFLITLLLFNATLFLVPALLLSYFLLKVHNFLWVSCLSFLNPDLDFVRYNTIRTLLDTHRNQGVISVLLSIKGSAKPDFVKGHIQELVNRRDKSGNLAYPRLQQCLVTKCGNYAWQRGKFDIEQNVTIAPFLYKGRAVTPYNIQDYVSEIVAKYLPSGAPPWQVIVIPSSEDNHHYILVKLHHLLLSEGVNVGDMLPIIPPPRPATGPFVSKSPLVDILKRPVVISVLKEKLTEEISNRWNEFVSSYDPLENVDLLKDGTTLLQFLCITLISVVATVKECRKGFRVIRSDPFSRIKYAVFTLLKETEKREVTPHNFFLSVLRSLDPRVCISTFIRAVWYLWVILPLRIPALIYQEILALHACIRLNYCPYPRTAVGILYTYVPLLYNSAKELFSMLMVLFAAPKTIIQDILMQEESLQTITLCGRKAVSWSDPVNTEFIRNVAQKLGVSETEVMLSAVSMCLSKFVAQTNQNIPEYLPITMRNINSNYILATGPNIKPEDAVSGIICMNLPIVDPEKDTTQLENLLEISKKFNESIQKQGLSHLLTMLQTKFGILTKFLPATLVSVYLKYLSRKYAVTVTELTNRYPNVIQRTLWGQEVTSVIYWRPPQANTCISLCLNEYADHIRLAVMCDAQLAPQHPLLAQGFPEFVKDLANSARRLEF